MTFHQVMERFYLPRHLLMELFDDKQIEFRFGDTEAFRQGTLQMTVFDDGSCSIEIIELASVLGTVHAAAFALTSDMLGQFSWDANNRVFRGNFATR